MKINFTYLKKKYFTLLLKTKNKKTMAKQCYEFLTIF